MWGVGHGAGGGGTADPPATAPCGRRCPVVLVVSRGALPDSRACPGLSLSEGVGHGAWGVGRGAGVRLTHLPQLHVDCAVQLY